MSQGDVMNVLNKAKDKLSCKDIAKMTGVSRSTVNSNLRKLFKNKDIDRIRIKLPFNIPGYTYLYEVRK